MATTSSTPQPSQQPLATAQAAVEEQRRPISLGRESGSVLVLLIFVAVLILTTNDFLTLTNLRQPCQAGGRVRDPLGRRVIRDPDRRD